MKAIKVSSPKLTELKEAMTDTLVNRTYSLISGEGDFGTAVFGQKPSKQFTSGFLLARFKGEDIEDESDDEVSDIHICSMGMDFQVTNKQNTEITVKAGFNIYIRTLPSWEELSNEDLRIMPTIQIKTNIHSEINRLVRADYSRSIENKKLTFKEKSKIYRQHYLEHAKSYGIVAKLNESEDGSIDKEDSDFISYTFLQGSQIPDDLAKQIQIPEKWEKICIPDMVFKINSLANTDTVSKFEALASQEIKQTVELKVKEWLTNGGDKTVYRGGTLMPSQICDEEAWDVAVLKLQERSLNLDDILPDFSRIQIRFQSRKQFASPEIRSTRVVIENNLSVPKREKRKEHAIHQVRFQVSLDESSIVGLNLDRVKPSYRFRDFMIRPAIGVNCGVKNKSAAREDGGRTMTLLTTWAPRFYQARMTTRQIAPETVLYKNLSDESYDVSKLTDITDAYTDWIETQRKTVDPTLNVSDLKQQAIEKTTFDEDLKKYEKETLLIIKGIKLLTESQQAYRQDKDCEKAIPYKSWLLLNQSFYHAGQKKGFDSWRLFQAAFILAHVSTLASRIPAYRDYYDDKEDETVTLLYFATGGGKSEAFYGLLIYGLFLDRFRGKHRGVTAMIRYPLRLLTLQQAQRLFALLRFANELKIKNDIPGANFEIGFWVGNANTPNKNLIFEKNKPPKKIMPDVPDLHDPNHPDDSKLSVEYEMDNESYNKVGDCPFCQQSTGLRRLPEQYGRVAIVCHDKSCEWNSKLNKEITPLPFLLTDEDIYHQSPCILLGTVDKVALIAHHPTTIARINGMFGLGRFITDDGLLLNDRRHKSISESETDPNISTVAPIYRDGSQPFFDPIPSLIIQDEAHLLEESLGTFSGIFETILETVFIGFANYQRAYCIRDKAGSPRMPKVVSATATVSTPGRQMEALYQREFRQFPYPGTSMYESFYVEPQSPEGICHPDRRNNLEGTDLIEQGTPLMRMYVSMMTNGGKHTQTTVSIIAAYHSIIWDFWQRLVASDSDEVKKTVVEDLIANLSTDYLHDVHKHSLEAIIKDNDYELLGSVLDLFRISLSYVTNKKGGDQIMSALHYEYLLRLRINGFGQSDFVNNLISGGVDIKGIQDIMKQAEKGSQIGKDLPELSTELRNITATSAISHGVDVDKFNAMFFMGTPSKIAEYIQASSRIGRTHVGFSMLIPIPQSRRDRYIVETHDVFHRFLERMISPAAVERWALNAIRRTYPSIFCAWLWGKMEPEASINNPKNIIHSLSDFDRMVKRVGRQNIIDSLVEFTLSAVGVRGRGAKHIGRPNNFDFYEAEIKRYAKDVIESYRNLGRGDDPIRNAIVDTVLNKEPMTSLRDVDEAGDIRVTDKVGVTNQNSYQTARKKKGIAAATLVVRGQRSRVAETDKE